MRTCKKHNVSGIATYGDCPQCIKEQKQHGDLKHSPEYLTKLLEECEDELELKTIALANARKWESLSATEVCAGNPAIAEYVASLESRLDQSKKLYDLTLGNQMDWMRKWQEKSNEVAELHAKDSVRTREYNTLVQENRALHAALSASENVSDQTPRTQDVANTTDGLERLSASVLFVPLLADDVRLVIGALDSLGSALADHHHQWSVGEREIYEQSVELLERAISSSCGCMVPDSLASGIFPLPKPCSEQHFQCAQSSSRSLASECSPWRVASLALLRLVSMPCRCFVWICSWCLSWVGGETRQAG